ncbi:YpiF family protein [Aquibacillus salsiterrae]|uniref:YpiF family protein n=1 Tax=Aquibacillus salsiterrae TaxID=2950439 RepID=A0A9X3WAA8_9BACI|nr:YpiF family protein [Aquibacillus salsiterrae]MDC3415367.1 YpiF family protein [Aquibacillus salsiterrae]
MQMNRKDLEQFIEAKEYVDTLLIPLSPVSINGDEQGKKVVFQGELLQIFCNEIEKYYTGRIFLFPPYYYLVNGSYQNEVERLNKWVGAAKEHPFEHVFFLTFDHFWKKQEKNIDGHLLWFPTMTSGDLHSKENQSLIKEQIEQIKQLITSYW